MRGLRVMRCAGGSFCAIGVILLSSAVASGFDSGNTSKEINGILLLRNGRVVDGRITQSAVGFVVELSHGSMMIPYSLVRFRAASRDHAYRKLHTMMPRRSLRSNLGLARWCISNRLYKQAQAEIREALSIEPGNTFALRMQRRLDVLLDPDASGTSAVKKTLAERLMAPEVKSLAGLSRHTARQYISKIQPILMNNCATAGCHGPAAENGFRLSRIRLNSGNRRGRSEQNLAVAFKFIDPKRPEQSPLLTKPSGNHGRRGRSVYRGRAGTRQRELLRQWIRVVARESAGTDTLGSGLSLKQNSSANRSRNQSSRRNTPRLRKTSILVRGLNYQPTPAMRAIRAQVEKRRIVNDIRRDGRKDDFDPTDFNRKAQLRNLRNAPSRQRKRTNR
ncbi:MAG: hypothetical protein IID45_01365 [Planctomycetes bacterium]|nr:hypothetical protein [Planctomycetota bacterium]